MTEQEMIKQVNDRERQKQLEEEMAKEEADVLDSQSKMHTLGESVEQTTGMLAADIEEAAAMKVQSTEKDVTEIAGKVERDVTEVEVKLAGDVEEAATGKRSSRFDVDLTSNIKEPEAQAEDDVYMSRKMARRMGV